MFYFKSLTLGLAPELINLRTDTSAWQAPAKIDFCCKAGIHDDDGFMAVHGGLQAFHGLLQRVQLRNIAGQHFAGTRKAAPLKYQAQGYQWIIGVFLFGSSVCQILAMQVLFMRKLVLKKGEPMRRQRPRLA